MTPSELLDLVKDWEAVFGGAFGALAGWLSHWLQARLLHERNVIDTTSLENEQLRLALERERFLTDKLKECGTQYAALWKDFYEREEITKKYHSAALIARFRVNELEAKAGLPVTQFEGLGTFPSDNDITLKTHKKENYESNYTGTSSSPVCRRKTVIGKGYYSTSERD